MTNSRLFLTRDEPETCYVSGELLEEREVTLTLLTSSSADEEVLILLYSPGKNIFYLDIPTLAELVSDLELRMDEIHTFVIDYQEVPTFIASPEGQIPFAEMVQQAKQPQASSDDARAVPPSGETWQLAGRAGGWVEDLGDGQAGLSYFYVVVDERGLVRATVAMTEDDAREKMLLLLYQAMVHPGFSGGELQPKRPKTVLVQDETLLDGLVTELSPLGVRVVFGNTPLADEALDSLSDYLGEPRKPYLSKYSEGEVKGFFRAAAAFYKAKPWKRFAPQKFLAFKLDDGAWHYANVMGQEGQEFGLAMFRDWLQVCRFIHNLPSPFEMMTGQGSLKQLKAAGGAESFSLSEVFAYHPEDIRYMQALKIKPEAGGLYPTVARFGVVANKPELQDPEFSLMDYTLLLQAIAEVLTKRQTKTLSSVKTTLELNGHRLELRYPAKGEETPVRDARSFRLTIEGDKDKARGNYSPLDRGEDIVVEVSAESTCYDIAKALRKANSSLHFMGFGVGGEPDASEGDAEEDELEFEEGEDELEDEDDLDEDDVDEEDFLNIMLPMNTSGTLLWSDRNGGIYGPHMRIGDIAHLSPLWAERWLSHFTLRLEPLADTDIPEGVRVVKA